MWIGELRVTNFRDLRGEHILKLTKGLNLIRREGPDNTWITSLTEAIKAALGYYEADQRNSPLFTASRDSPDLKIDWGGERPHCAVEVDVVDGGSVYACSFRAMVNERNARATSSGLR